MSTPFDVLPITFAESTIERLVKEHLKMQIDGLPNFSDNYSDEFRADVIESLLHNIIEYPSDDNSSVIILAVHAIEWVERVLRTVTDSDIEAINSWFAEINGGHCE